MKLGEDPHPVYVGLLDHSFMKAKDHFEAKAKRKARRNARVAGGAAGDKKEL